MAARRVRHDVSLWHQYKVWMENYGSHFDPLDNWQGWPLHMNTPYNECRICHDSELDLPYIPEAPVVTEAVVLVCGHMFCRPCYQDWEDFKIGPESRWAAWRAEDQPNPATARRPHELSCPTCRRDLHFVGCEHPYRAVPVDPQRRVFTREPVFYMDLQNIGKSSKVPGTIPEEDDGVNWSPIPTKCHECRAAAARRIADLVENCRRGGLTRKQDVEAVFNLQGMGPEEIAILDGMPEDIEPYDGESVVGLLLASQFLLADRHTGTGWSRTAWTMPGWITDSLIHLSRLLANIDVE
ncbi:hypothetical protein QBC44DRAFT_368678 [Cladorrhinum sp. PSN332]|nr:hypothetical protein QBC44DRAFT_368678 [Cladorrhinum sp. PSN332]